MTFRWSIVMLAMNAKARTIASISTVRRAIMECKEPVELIVVDNGSTDGLLHWLINQDDIVVIDNGKNLGVPKARNMALKVASGDAILFLDNDVDLSSNAITLLDRKLSRPDVGMAGDSGSVFVPEWAEKEAFSHDMTDENFPGVNFIVGYCMAIKKSVIDEVGFFDEDYPLFYWEDIDYGIRVREAGYSLGIMSNICFHYGRTTVAEVARSGEVARIEKQGRLRTLQKHSADCPTWVLAVARSGDPKNVEQLEERLSEAKKNVVLHVVSPELSVPGLPPWRVCMPAEKYPRSSYTRVCIWDGDWHIGPYAAPKRDDEIQKLNDPLTRRAW